MEQRQEVLQCACDFLGRREHSREELRYKLSRNCNDELLIEDILDTLQAEGLQSDERFTENFIHHRLNRGHGPLKIRQELRQKGVMDELIDVYLFTDEHDWYRIVREVRQKRFGAELPEDTKNKAKQSRFLYSRGFDTELINHAFCKVDE